MPAAISAVCLPDSGGVAAAGRSAVLRFPWTF